MNNSKKNSILQNCESLIHDLTHSKKAFKPFRSPDEYLTVKEAAAYLGFAMKTMYIYMSGGKLPVFKKSGHCYFRKEDLENLKKLQRKKSFAEIAQENDEIKYGKKRGPKHE